MGHVLISLVITTYNRATLLGEALESVAQSLIDDHDHVEVIVVDNNSTDATRQTVEDIRAGGFPFALRYVLERNQGLSYARNRGADEAQGDYVAYMDDDQRLEGHFLERLEAVFLATHATCVGGPLCYYNKDHLPYWLPPLLKIVGERNLGDKPKVVDPTKEKLIGGNMAFDRTELLAIGKYNVRLGRSGGSLLAGEEDELQERLHAAGKVIAYDPGLVQYHYLDPVRRKKRFWRRHHFGHGRSLYRAKYAKNGTSEGPTFFDAPRWMWRCLFTREIPRALRPLMRLDFRQGFYKQLDVCVYLGQVYEARLAHRAPTRSGDVRTAFPERGHDAPRACVGARDGLQQGRLDRSAPHPTGRGPGGSPPPRGVHHRR